MAKEKNHRHDWEPIAYFFAEEDNEEWLILECDDEECMKQRVVKGESLREWNN